MESIKAIIILIALPIAILAIAHCKDQNTVGKRIARTIHGQQIMDNMMGKMPKKKIDSISWKLNRI